MAGHHSNPLRRRLAAGEVAIIALGFNSADLCDFLGPMGFDAAFVDFEHGGFDWREISDISRACDLWEMGTAVRVPQIDEALILRALDLGANSIIVPHVITPEQAERAARACRYPPEGNRGVAGNRRSYGASDYFRLANDEVQCIALIEDAPALDNLDALLQVEGVDVFQVAPSDLAASMGHLGNPGHPAVQQAISDAIEAIVAAGRVAGTLVDDENAERYVAAGVRCLIVAWPRWVAAGATAFLGRVRSGVAPSI